CGRPSYLKCRTFKGMSKSGVVDGEENGAARRGSSAEQLHERAQLLQVKVRAGPQAVNERLHVRHGGLRPGEARGHHLTPLRHPRAARRMDAGRLVGGEEIAVAIVLVLVLPGVLPVVEDLAAQKVPPHAPGVLPSPVAQQAIAHADGVRIDELEEMWLSPG